METDPEVTLIIALTDMGINTILYYVPYVQKGRGKMNFIKQKHERYTKKTNAEPLEMKIAMSGMKNILEEISSLLDTAEEKTGTFGKLVMETIQNEIRIEKKKRHFTHINSSNLNKIVGRHYNFPHFTHKHTAERNQLIHHTNSHGN